jgi:hypothetical protein
MELANAIIQNSKPFYEEFQPSVKVLESENSISNQQ